MKIHRSFSALALVVTLGAGIISVPIAARASEAGKRNTALGLGALAAGLLLTQRNKLPGVVAAGAAAYAYSNYNADVQNRHRYEDGYYGGGYSNDRYQSSDRYNNGQYNNDRYNNGRYNNGQYNNGGSHHTDERRRDDNRADRDSRYDEYSSGDSGSDRSARYHRGR